MSENNIQKMQSLYAAFGRGDINTILSNVSDDADWGTDTVANAVPWYGIRRGREGVADFFATLDREVEFTTFEPKVFAAASRPGLRPRRHRLQSEEERTRSIDRLGSRIYAAGYRRDPLSCFRRYGWCARRLERLTAARKSVRTYLY